jgi:ATP-dependent DNA helicase RecG
MQKSLEKLLKILNLEIQAKYANKAIIGGLDKFYPNWVVEARSENVPVSLLEQLQIHFSNYANMEAIERENSTKAVLASIRNINSAKEKGSEPQKVFPVQKPEPIKPADESSFPNKVVNRPIASALVQPNEPGIGLNAPVSVLNGIGDVKGKIFKEIGVQKLGDLFYYFPRRYDDYSQLKPINRIEYDEELTIIATVQSYLTTRMRGKDQGRVEVVVSDGTGFLRLVFFRSMKYIQSFENHFRRGTQLVISGKVTMYLGRLQINNPNFELLDQTHLNTNGIIPVYPLTSGLSQKDIRTSISNAIKYYVNRIPDHLPTSIKSSAELVDLPVALQQIHYPDNYTLLKAARDRLAFDEIFFLQLGVQQQKRSWHSLPARKYQLEDEQLLSITNHLPFSLTNAQNRVIQEIRQDLNSGYPMNRLIQGDVGSGKTIVAAIASVTVNLSDGQTAFMAPTSILAEQH